MTWLYVLHFACLFMRGSTVRVTMRGHMILKNHMPCHFIRDFNFTCQPVKWAVLLDNAFHVRTCQPVASELQHQVQYLQLRGLTYK